MSIIWAEGFEHYGVTPNGGRDQMLNGAWALFTAGNGVLPFISTDQARTGTRSLKIEFNDLATDSPKARRVLGSAQITIGNSMGVYFSSLPEVNKGHGFEFNNNLNQCIAYFAVESDGAIGLYTGSTRTLLASSDPVITANAWQHIEAKIIADEVVGYAECRVNGQVVLQLTDINLGALGCTQIVYGMPAGKFGDSMSWYIDDIVTWNTVGTENVDFLGAVRVETIFPVADTSEADWTIFGTTDGYDAIDEVPADGDTTYIYAETAGDISEFTLDTLPPETSDIRGVYVPFKGKLIAAGTGNVRASLVSGVDVSEGPDTVLTSAYTYWGGVHELDPATALPWTKSGLEAALLRVEKTV